MKHWVQRLIHPPRNWMNPPQNWMNPPLILIYLPTPSSPSSPSSPHSPLPTPHSPLPTNTQWKQKVIPATLSTQTGY
ncbi:hypothetical protein H1Q63_31290 [Desmonostoc muscorum CCALA 125]|nr:hypothetical protein [Desmonostoc muscorum CCALA 125]